MLKERRSWSSSLTTLAFCAGAFVFEKLHTKAKLLGRTAMQFHISSTSENDNNQKITKSVMDLTKQSVYVRKKKGKNIGDVEAIKKDTIMVKTD